jgi:hypothetical protein
VDAAGWEYLLEQSGLKSFVNYPALKGGA